MFHKCPIVRPFICDHYINMWQIWQMCMRMIFGSNEIKLEQKSSTPTHLNMCECLLGASPRPHPRQQQALVFLWQRFILSNSAYLTLKLTPICWFDFRWEKLSFSPRSPHAWSYLCWMDFCDICSNLSIKGFRQIQLKPQFRLGFYIFHWPLTILKKF